MNKIIVACLVIFILAGCVGNPQGDPNCLEWNFYKESLATREKNKTEYKESKTKLEDLIKGYNQEYKLHIKIELTDPVPFMEETLKLSYSGCSDKYKRIYNETGNLIAGEANKYKKAVEINDRLASAVTQIIGSGNFTQNQIDEAIREILIYPSN